MTEIAFHVNVPDKLGYGCRLLRKAYLTGAKITVTGEAETLADLDQLLWRFSAVEFLPHCNAEAAIGPLAATPIVLSASPDASPHSDVLVNIGQTVPAEFERFARFIELVALEPDDVETGRSRWKHYKKRGYALTKHEYVPPGLAL